MVSSILITPPSQKHRIMTYTLEQMNQVSTNNQMLNKSILNQACNQIY